LSFGKVSDSNNIIKKKLKITNRGNERGYFQITQMSKNEAVQFSSYSGFVEPKDEIHLTAKMIADFRKEIREEIKINREALRAPSPVELQSRRATSPGELLVELAGHAAANQNTNRNKSSNFLAALCKEDSYTWKTSS